MLIDNRNDFVKNPSVAWIKRICHRRFGIGADGLILLQLKDGFDFEMIYFNSDGMQSSMCGNGGRCIVAFAHRLDLTGNNINFSAIDGAHEALITFIESEEIIVSLKMIDVMEIESYPDFYVLNTGSPHYVTFVENLNELNVYEEGKKIRNSVRFEKDGINVNFVKADLENKVLHVRTFERGVEDETWSCGTGVTAVALVAGLTSQTEDTFHISTPGGNLEVSFERSGLGFKNIWLKGPATHVYDGLIGIRN